MPWELEDGDGARYRLPASIQPAQLHVGGRPRARFVRGYGSADWYRVLDGVREPEALNLTGVLATDQDALGIQDQLDALVAAAEAAVKLVHVDHSGVDVQYLPLQGALPVTTEPDGVDGTLLTVTLPLVPGSTEWVVLVGS